ncbi:MAG TPA: hypothetical protein VFX44_08530 [Solirubrobacterales bacterium]|nr:hypothetical protein [Solirubrobacterales bacterium]
MSADEAKRERQLANLTPAPPAPAGNTRAVKHGAESDRLIAPLADRLVPDVLDANPHLDPLRDGAAIVRYARLVARIEHVWAWLDEQPDPVFDDRDAGTTHPVFGRLERWERQAGMMERALAIAPLTRAHLGLAYAAAADLSTAMSERDPERRRELMRQAGVELDEGDEG